MAIEYHCVESCNKCRGENSVKCTDSLDGKLSEAKTTCLACGHEDYWAYGWFESGQHMKSSCKTYSFSSTRK